MIQSPVGGFGATLREARERRGMSLRQIAAATRISIAALEALERNDISKLPGGIFSRAFVRGYATEVGLDAEQTVHAFIEQFPQDSVTAGHPASRPVDEHLEIESDRRAASAFLWMIVVSVPIAGALLYFGITRGSVQSAVQVTPAEIRGPSTADQPVTAVQATNAVPTPTTLPAPTVAPTAASAVMAPTVAPPTGGPRPDAPRVQAAASGEPLAANLTVVLTASGPCWLSVTADGQRIVQRQLKAGERQTIQGTGEIVLTAGDPSTLTATINGALAKPLGAVGKTVTIRLTPANFKEYLLTP